MHLKSPIEPSKGSAKKIGVIRAFAANTNPGLVRNYNEDRVAIILNILKPVNRASKDKGSNEEWPSASLFGVYDGHGGYRCADYLRDNVHNYLVQMSQYPSNPALALHNALLHSEEEYKKENISHDKQGTYFIKDKSGSCALVIIVMKERVFIANIGDSRAVMSCNGGTKVVQVSQDHRPDQDFEKDRVELAGGKVYQSQAIQNFAGSPTQQPQQIIFQGPMRVLPGRLSVSRTIGDLEAKVPQLGGNPKVVIAESSTKTIEITDETDFIVLGCDGIFDKLTNLQVVQAVYETQKSANHGTNIHQFTAKATENILKKSLISKSLDNVTVVMIAFKNLKRLIFGSKKHNMSPTYHSTLNAFYNGNASRPVIDVSFQEDQPNQQ